MDKKSINKALDKFYNGETTVAEEKELFEALIDSENEEFAEHREQFAFFEREKFHELPADFDDKMTELLQEQDNVIPIKRSFQNYWWAAAAVVLMALGLVWWNQEAIQKIEWIEVASALDKSTEVNLPDGSIVTLNKNSTLRYPTEFGVTREVYFEGEAYFDISHNPEKSFKINTEHTLVEVLGTSFSVRSYPDESEAIVNVTSGKVAFSSIKEGLQEKVFLQKDEWASYDIESNRIIKSTKSVNHLAWKTGILNFEDELISDVIADLEHYFDIRVEVKNDDLLNCHFQGKFENGELATILEVLSYTMNITHEVKGGVYFLSGPGCESIDLQ